MTEFQKELQKLINKYSQESGSKYLTSCLAAFDAAVTKRERWYGREQREAGAATSAQLNSEAIFRLDAPSAKCEN